MLVVVVVLVDCLDFARSCNGRSLPFVVELHDFAANHNGIPVGILLDCVFHPALGVRDVCHWRGHLANSVAACATE